MTVHKSILPALEGIGFMLLDQYAKKRRPGSNEPGIGAGEPGSDSVFVVHKHRATNLHYDLRLELRGVLKSWAIPKGPSLDPREKRLAIAVEDHPLSYKDFEGIIPRGHYGAGEVIIWDRGTFNAKDSIDKADSEKKILQGLQKGSVHFILQGEKLRGEFILVRTQFSESSWLLIKVEDQYVAKGDLDDGSVESGKGLEELTQQSRQDEAVKVKTSLPPQVEPMLAKLTAEPFDKKGWGFEVKWDGYRTLAESNGKDVKLYSRRGNSFTNLFKPIALSLSRLSHQYVLDGEVVVLDRNGRSKFELLQNYQNSRRGDLRYYVFDLLYLDGFDIRSLPLSDRRSLLEKLITEKVLDDVIVSKMVEEKGKDFFENFIERNDLEGMVAKNLHSVYKAGKRSEDWLKIKRNITQDAVIGGFTAGEGGRRLGALLLGVYYNDQLQYIGRVGTGFDAVGENSLLEKLERIKSDRMPFSAKPYIDRYTTWVNPELICAVKFLEWTREGLLRAPVFLGLRKDKASKEVIKEMPEAVPPAIELLSEDGDGKEILVEGKKIPVRNYRKLYWPEDGYTKMDMVDYYRQIAPFILPYLKDRPMSLHRFPNGIGGEGFYQKNTSELHLPPDIETVSVYSSEEGRETRYFICQNEYSLVYLANLGCVELNPWNSRAEKADFPDYLIIDLDPLDVPFSLVVDVAVKARDVLSALGIESYCKTSGATGLHIYVPLQAKYSHEQARLFGEVIANLIHQKLPLVTSLERQPAKRNKKVYLDYLQNAKGQTVAAPYSLRPLPGATVSTPLKWSELGPSLSPDQFTIKNIFARLEKVGDLWQPVLGQGVDLLKALKKVLPS